MTIQIACCQIAPDVENLASNAERARAAIAGAVAAGADIVVVPELVNSGYVFESAEEARAAAVPVDGELLRGWQEEAARGAAMVIGGFCELGDDGHVYNSSALVDADGVLAVYRKLHLWAHEQQWFARGEAPPPVIDTRHGRIGLGVCYDLEFPELTRGLALAGADLIVLPTNWPREPAEKEAARGGLPMLSQLAGTTAYLNKVFVAVCDRCGTERELAFEGGSAIADPTGALLAVAPEDRGEHSLLAACDLAMSADKSSGELNDAFADRRPDQYSATLTAAALAQAIPQ
jgi:predicted amidohydrolase